MLAPSNAPDPDDFFADTRMSIGDHIEELRTYLLRAIVGFLIGMAFSLFVLGKPVVNLITAPVERELLEFWRRTAPNRNKTMERIVDQQSLPPIVLDVVLDVRPIAAAMGMPAKERPVLQGVFDGYEDLLKELQLNHRLHEHLEEEQHWVKMQMRMQDPKQFLGLLVNTKHYFDPPLMRTLSVTEAMMVYFKVSMLTGLVLSSPWVFFQIWAFIAAGLYPHEKKLVHVYMPFSLGLFLSGVLLCQFFVIPKAIEALLWFNEFMGMQPDLRLNEWLNFAIMMPVVFGISFQTPLVMMFVHRIGLMEVEGFRKQRRLVFFGLIVFAAVITPSVDIPSLLMLWLPMVALYEVGIYLCVWQDKQRGAMAESSEYEGLIEI